LGWEFRDRAGGLISSWTGLPRLQTIRPPRARFAAPITVAVDVRNPLLGARGATRVYGLQKGLRAGDLIFAERCLRRLAAVCRRQFGDPFAAAPGAGAAGGLGFGLRMFAAAKLQPGFDLIAAAAALERQLDRADLVVTGEGALDATTIMGKGCGQLARRCRHHGLPCIALAGTVAPCAAPRSGFTQRAGLTELTSLREARRHPAPWLARLAANTAANLVCKPPPRR
jgi:glycerate 2-kinase